MSNFPIQLPHGEIQEVLPDVFVVKGLIRIEADQTHEFSRNMTIIRDNGDLTLVNTIRLDAAGLSSLDRLGTVRHIIKLGSFHGRDDAFYVDRYGAKLWAPAGMEYSRGETTDETLVNGQPGPNPDASTFVFDTPKFPEAILLLERHGGIIVTCDSLQNTLGRDEYFNDVSAESKARLGFFGKATVGPGFRKVAEPKAGDFSRLKELEFRHLLSAHGDPLLEDAHQAVSATIAKLFSA